MYWLLITLKKCQLREPLPRREGNFEERSKENFTWIHKVLGAIMTKKFCRFINALHLNLNFSGPAWMPVSNWLYFNPQSFNSHYYLPKSFVDFWTLYICIWTHFFWGSVLMTIQKSKHMSEAKYVSNFLIWCYCLKPQLSFFSLVILLMASVCISF